MIVKVLFAPIGIGAGLVAGMLAKKGFERIWTAFDDEEPPAPDQGDAQLSKLVPALIVEGAVFRLTKGLVDHGARRAFAGATGTWPGEQPSES
jgi:hypothetical protein